MDVDPYRLAYNVLHHNWIKFGIPKEDIPPPSTEKVESLDTIIPGFSIAVVLFQIASRKDLKTFLDKECPPAHDLNGVYTRFENIMREVLPKDAILVDSPNNEEVSQDTTEDYLSEDSLEVNMSEDIKKEKIYNDDGKEGVLVTIGDEDLLDDCKKEGLPENATKESLEGIILFEDIPGLMAYSLAVCTELVLFEKDNEKVKEYMKSMPDIWKKYFDENLKPLCKKAHYTQGHLTAYSHTIKCPEKFLNQFISENKNEYEVIADKFCDYTDKNYATESPEHIKFKTQVRKISKGMSFLKMKTKFAALKDICKSLPQNVKNEKAIDEIPLLTDYSPSSSRSTPSSPSSFAGIR